MLPKKWMNLERQRPALRWPTWGMGIGAVITAFGLLGAGSWVFGLVVLGASGIWAYSILSR